MPQISPGGKYIFGWSTVRPDGRIRIPDEAVEEYRLEPGERVILVSGSRTSGGCIVMKKAWLLASPLSGVLEKNPVLDPCSGKEGETVRFKGRLYCWTIIREGGVLELTPRTLESFSIRPGDRFLSIRGSNIACVMAQKGPLVTKAVAHPEVPEFP